MNRNVLLVAFTLVAGCGPGVGPGGGPSSASCREQYSLSALGSREFAFEGTVLAFTPRGGEAGGADVRFRVDEWFRGGPGSETTLTTYSGSVPSSDGKVDLSVGKRVLVSGDGTNIWSCGFTQPYSAELASSWRVTLKP